MILSELIKQAYQSDAVVTAHVFGDFNYGKTSYALWTAYEVLGSWDRVLQHLFFSPAEAIEALKKAVYSGKRLPIIIMDDAGLWLDRLTWWETHKVVFMRFFNLIRSVTAGVIFTSPSEELPKQILKKCFLRVSVSPISTEELRKLFDTEEDYLKTISWLNDLAEKYGLRKAYNLARGYRLKTLPSFMNLVQKSFYDVYLYHYPVYKQYTRKRAEAVRKWFEEWAETVKVTTVSPRHKLIMKAREMLENGYGKSDVAKYLMNHGVPKATAYRWVNKLIKATMQIQ